jgi:hypothetical protein
MTAEIPGSDIVFTVPWLPVGRLCGVEGRRVAFLMEYVFLIYMGVL